jgi:hypothetical protein
MSEKSAATSDGPGKRVNRRVQWKPDGVEVDPSFQDQPLEATGEDWAERSLSNDEQLKRDKPPHWG